MHSLVLAQDQKLHNILGNGSCKKFCRSGKGGARKADANLLGKRKEEKCHQKEENRLILKKALAKKPKGSGRRLYTDENPKDTCQH